ncbi:PAS domain-containing sensor histidine kinase [Pedobacter sp. MW01-1-1]|uniref:PAS domain-containing sensor histidine kinase n=1 Tax=Pedobacter sp. MW01-1-1 TaxID=3383027 RepID=UPI003FF0BCC4
MGTITAQFLNSLLEQSTQPILLTIGENLVPFKQNTAFKRFLNYLQIDSITSIDQLFEEETIVLLKQHQQRSTTVKASSFPVLFKGKKVRNTRFKTELHFISAENESGLYLTFHEIEPTPTDFHQHPYAASFFKDYFEKVPLGLCVLKGPDLVTEFANEEILNLWGKNREEVIGKPLEIARPEITENQQHTLVEQVKNIFKTETALQINNIRITTPAKDGYFNAIYQPIKDENNSVVAILAILNDISEQVTYRNELNRAKDILKLAMDASKMGSWNVDLINRTLYLSERARAILGLDTERISMRRAKELIVSEQYHNIAIQVKEAIKNRASFNVECQIKATDLEYKKWLRCTGTAHYDNLGIPKYIAGALLDISEVKENDIKKNDFIGMVSHELKTPLTSLTAYNQLLKSKLNNKNVLANEIIDKMSGQLKRMLEIIEGFLSVSTLESGQLQLYIEPFNLTELINKIAEENRHILPNHFIQVLINTDLWVKADEDKISNVLTNLISNAAKYSKHDTLIAITHKIENEEAIICVQDEGIGIAEDELPKLFDRFYRVHNANAKTISGFGVGLYICAELIKQHGGRIWAESKPNEGSSFYFSLPLLNPQSIEEEINFTEE